MNIQEGIEKLKTATAMPNKEAFAGNMEIGDEIRQGDVIVRRIEQVDQNGPIVATPNEEFTVANSHVLSGAKVLALPGGNFEFSVDEQAVLRHNDHAHPDASHRTYHFHRGYYGVSFQMDLLTKRRVVD